LSKLKITKSLGDSYVYQYMTCPQCNFFLATEEFDSNGGFGPKESYQYFRHCPLCGWKEWQLVEKRETPRVYSKNPEKEDKENAIFIVNSIDNLEQEDINFIKDYLSKIENINHIDIKKFLLSLTFDRE
jgi:hypothetical protein